MRNGHGVAPESGKDWKALWKQLDPSPRPHVVKGNIVVVVVVVVVG